MSVFHSVYASSVVPVYSTEAQAYFSRMTVQPDFTRKGLLNNFISGCITDGNWSEIDALWIHAAHDVQACKLNLKSSSFTCVFVNTPIFNIDRGVKGDAATSYTDTNYDPFYGVKFKQDSASFGLFQLTCTIPGDSFAFQNECYIAPSTGFKNALNSNGNGGFITASSMRGFFSAGRSSAATFKEYINGALQTTITEASLGIGPNNAYLGCRNVGSPNGFGNNEYAMTFFGSGLVDHTLLNQRISTYLTSIGV